MSIINWIALALSLVLWMIQLQIGAGVGMASSAPMRKGSREDVYLDRVEAVRGIVFFGALLTFISQLIDSPAVKNIGLIILAISFLSVAILWSGLLSHRLPAPDLTEEEQLAILSNIHNRMKIEGWTARQMDDRTVFWSRPEKRNVEDTDTGEDNQQLF
jgi:hypothetical protein